MKIIPTETGMPDRCVFLGRGRCVFIELKQSRGRLRPKQRAMHARLLVCGYRVYTLFGADDVERFLNEELPELIRGYWPQPDFTPAQPPARQGVAGGTET